MFKNQKGGIGGREGHQTIMQIKPWQEKEGRWEERRKEKSKEGRREGRKKVEREGGRKEGNLVFPHRSKNVGSYQWGP